MTNQRRIKLLLASAIICIAVAQAFAQGKRKPAPKPAAKKAATTADSAVTTAADPQLREYDSTKYRYFLFPQFYSYWPITNNDTILRFECYNTEGHFVNMDTIYDVSDIKTIYFTKTYNDYTETIIDAEGRPRPKPISKKIYQYSRTGADSWSALDLIYQVPSTLVEYRKDIVRTDTTTIIDRVNGTRQVTVRKYYKTLETEKDNETREAPVTILPNSDPGQSASHFISVFYAPEFYFYQPKTSRDTIFEFKCYDSRDSEILNVTNYDSVRFYSLFKSFTDSTHTYKDKNREKKFLPVSTIVKRYDHIADNKWMSIEYPGNKYEELRVYKDQVVRTDTVTIEDPITGSTIQKAFNYYKAAK